MSAPNSQYTTCKWFMRHVVCDSPYCLFNGFANADLQVVLHVTLCFLLLLSGLVRVSAAMILVRMKVRHLESVWH